MLAGIFGEYETAEKYYNAAIGLQNYDAATWRGLASAYQKWADADKPPPDIQARLSRALQQAITLSEKQLGKDNDFPVLLALADLHIETNNLIEAQGRLDEATQLCKASRLKCAEVGGRQGLLHFRAERYAKSVESFRKAINVRPDDLELQSNLGKAMLRAKSFAGARQEFSKVLKSAPGQVDALLGAAQACIGLGEEGEIEYYAEAEEQLSEALRHGRDTNTGSARLTRSRLDEAHYLRGYTRTKRWEARGRTAMSLALSGALRDFSQCQRHPHASSAATKIKEYLRRRAPEALLTRLGPYLIVGAALFILVPIQIDFFFHDSVVHRYLSPAKSIADPLTYAALTFEALLFMIAGLYLPNLLKFKVPGIELEKAATSHVSTPSSLGITLPSSWGGH